MSSALSAVLSARRIDDTKAVFVRIPRKGAQSGFRGVITRRTSRGAYVATPYICEDSPGNSEGEWFAWEFIHQAR